MYQEPNTTSDITAMDRSSMRKLKKFNQTVSQSLSQLKQLKKLRSPNNRNNGSVLSSAKKSPNRLGAGGAASSSGSLNK